MINFKFQLALPMNKDSVIIKSQGTGKKLKFFTPEGYKARNAFIKWIQSKGITEQIWYDRYYLNILLDSQRPRCKYKDCNNYVTFNYSKSNGYEYSEFCCHSCCQKNNWDRNNGESRNKLSKTNKQKYIDDESLRHKKSEETKEGFRKSGAYDLDENGKNRFSNSKLNFYKTEEGKDITIIGIGKTVASAMELAQQLENEEIEAEVINARFLKPFDKETIKKSIMKTKKVITLEDNTIIGGLGSEVKEIIAKDKCVQNIEIDTYGINDEFMGYATWDDIFKKVKDKEYKTRRNN